MTGRHGGRGHGPGGPAQDERGSALVEFALVGSLLMLLLFGIIEFGILLAMKGSVNQAAAEGARATIAQPYCILSGGVSHCTSPAPSTYSCSSPDGFGNDFGCLTTTAINQATGSVNWINSALGQTCSNSVTTVMQCHPTVAACIDSGGHTTAHYCLTMAVDYHYAGQPFFPSLPLMSAFMPADIPANSTVQLTDPN